jgi:hypothetical protein
MDDDRTITDERRKNNRIYNKKHIKLPRNYIPGGPKNKGNIR